MSIKHLVIRSSSRVLPAKLINVIKVVRDQIRKRQQRTKNEKVIDYLLQNRNTIQLELGAGGRKMKNWISIDISEQSDISLDLSRQIPFPDNCIAQIYSSHLLEHFSYPHPLMSLLSECYRILKPGGLFKVAVPNARIYIEAYIKPEKFDVDMYCRYKPGFHFNSKIDYVNYMAYMGGHHCYMFDNENLLMILANAGFKSCRLRDFDPDLDLEERKYESIYTECVK